MKLFVTVILIIILISISNAKIKAQDNYHSYSLDNGMKVLIIEDHSVPLVHIEIAFRSGGIVETSENDGLSHLYEHMIFNATKGYPSAKTYNNELLKNGIICDAGTDQEIVNYFFTLPSFNFITGLDLFIQGMLHPLFLDEELENERLIVDDEFKRAESSPSFLLDRMTDQKLWGNLFSRKNVIGDHNVILNARREQLVNLKDSYYHPNNALLVIAGDIEKDIALDQIKRNCNDWNPIAEDPFTTFPVPEFPSLGKTENFIMFDSEVEEPLIQIGWQGPDSRNDLKGLFASQVFIKLLNLENSIFNDQLVNSNLLYEFRGRATFRKYVCSMYLIAYPNEKKITQAIKAIEKEIKAWSTPGYFDEKQLQSAISAIIIEEAYNKEELSVYIDELAYRWSSADILTTDEYLNQIKEITLDDINELILKYITNQHHTSGLIVSTDQEELAKSLGWKIEN